MSNPIDAAPAEHLSAVWGTTEFVPGPHVGLVGHLTFGLIEAGHPGTRDQLWKLVASDASIDDILDVLSATGLKSLPSFGLVQVDGGQVRVVARGNTRIVALDAAGTERHIDPSGVRTWVEEVLADPALLTIRLIETDAASVGVGPAEPPSDDRFFVLAGSVPAWSLVRNFDGADPQAAVAAAGWKPIPATGDRANDRREAVEEHVEPAPQRPEYGADPLAIDSDQTISPSRFDEIDEEPGPIVTPGGKPTLTNEAEQPADNYDFIYGHTVARSVEAAAVREEETDELAPAGGGLISSVPVSTGEPPLAGDHDGLTNPPGTGASDAITPPLSGDHDGLTMTREQLAAMRSSDPPRPSALAPNEVLAVLCGDGHPNPPHAATCRSCGIHLGTSHPVAVSRPPLAVLVFSNGERVVADRPILIGRNPRVAGTATNELPRVVKFESAGQGLSRTHAEVRLEGWQLLLEDLQSTNGTEVTLPGQAQRRMHSGEPVVIVPGTSIDFGDELTCTVEVAT